MATIPRSDLEGFSLYVLGTEDNSVDSQVTVMLPEIDRGGVPFDDGVNDAHMGTTDHAIRCKSCLQSKKWCPGHYGEIRLRYPVQSPMFLKEIVRWLKVICFSCGRLVVEYQPLGVKRELILNEYARRVRTSGKQEVKCVHCGANHPHIVREKDDHITVYAEFTHGADKIRHPLYPHLIENIFQKVTPETVELMGKPLQCHPSKFILRVLRVSPNTIRPSAKKMTGGRSNHNNTTLFLQAIIKLNEEMPVPTPKAISDNLHASISVLELTVHDMIRGSSSPNARSVVGNSRAPLQSIAKRWPGKYGRIRRNLLGRRVVNMGRAFITCDPSLGLDEVGVPYAIAKEIQIPEVVREYNYQRMMQYFINGTKNYPGCLKVKKASGAVHWVERLKEDFVLEIGDTVYRDIVIGDVVDFNRQPSLEPSSVTAMRVVPMDGNSIRCNVLVCPLFNADFDGDAMNLLFTLTSRTANELRHLAGPGQFFISYKDSRPKLGEAQDSVIGCAELTLSKTWLDKPHAMQMFAQTDVYHDFAQYPAAHRFHGRDVISILLKETGNRINFTGTASFYNENHAAYRHYDPAETKVVIDRGELKSGVLDKAAIGQGSQGGIFHIVHNRYGPEAALKLAYDLQQVALMFMFNRGITISIGDITLHEEALREIHKIEESLIADSKLITERLNSGRIIPPIGRTVTEFYEEQQLSALNPAGAYWQHILSSIDPETNNLYKEIMHGAKGKDWNLQMISCAVGQILINGERIRENFGGRATMYSTKYDDDPRSRGFIANSYMSGLDLLAFILHAEDNRYQLINRALNTAVTGTHNRMSVKNLEAMLIDNYRRSANGRKIVQLIYGDDGADPRFLEKVRFPTMKADLTAARFRELYHGRAVFEADKRELSPADAKLLDEEFAALQADREAYLRVFMNMELMTGRAYSDAAMVPINVERIVEDIIYNLELRRKKPEPLPPRAVLRVRDLCENIPYVLINEIQERLRTPVPEHLRSATELICILIRSHLNYASMVRNHITEEALELVMAEIRMAYANSLVAYGKAMGLIAAQSISEPMTQLVLNSHHFSGQSSVRKAGIYRIREIILAKRTEDMRSPSMTLQMREDIRANRAKVQEVANHIEMLELRRFVRDWQIFFEPYGHPAHRSYKHEEVIISEFEKRNAHIKPPSDLMNWCIRFGLNKALLIEKHMRMEEIYYRIRQLYPFTHVVYTTDNAESLVIRIYLRNSAVKKGEATLAFVSELMSNILDTVIRGIPGVRTAHVKETMRTVRREDGSLAKEKVYYIFTDGTNLSAALDNEYIDPLTAQSDSIQEMAEIFGIDTARAKIIDELRFQIEGLAQRHYSVFADEMTYTGNVTSIDRYGNVKRNSSMLLQISDAAPVGIIENAAVNGAFDNLSGVSPPIMMGKNPNVGDLYNSFIIDEDMAKEVRDNIEKMLSDL